MRTADELLTSYQHVIADVRLITGSKGVFDVVVDGEILYSKDETGRHAEQGEVLEAFKSRYAADVPVYGT